MGSKKKAVRKTSGTLRSRLITLYMKRVAIAKKIMGAPEEKPKATKKLSAKEAELVAAIDDFGCHRTKVARIVSLLTGKQVKASEPQPQESAASPFNRKFNSIAAGTPLIVAETAEEYSVGQSGEVVFKDDQRNRVTASDGSGMEMPAEDYSWFRWPDKGDLMGISTRVLLENLGDDELANSL